MLLFGAALDMILVRQEYKCKIQETHDIFHFAIFKNKEWNIKVSGIFMNDCIDEYVNGI